MSDDKVVSIEKKLTPKEELLNNWHWLGYWSVMGMLDRECCERIWALEDRFGGYIEQDDEVFSDHIIRGIDRANAELKD